MYIASLEITHILIVDALWMVSLVLNSDQNPSTARRRPDVILRQLPIIYFTRISGYTHYEPWHCFIRHYSLIAQEKYLSWPGFPQTRATGLMHIFIKLLRQNLLPDAPSV